MTNYLECVTSVIDFAINGLPVDAKRMAVWGHSMGGFVALASAVRHGDKLRAVCGSQPSMGRTSTLGQLAEDWRTTGRATFSNSRFSKIELPYDFFLDRQQYDALGIVGKLDMPLLLIGGTEDDLVPAANVRQIYDAAREPKTYREFATGHDYKDHPEQLAAINEVTVDFFASAIAG